MLRDQYNLGPDRTAGRRPCGQSDLDVPPQPAAGVFGHMLTIEEVADLLRVSTRTVSRLIKQRQLNCHRIGRTIRISRDDLRAYIAGARS